MYLTLRTPGVKVSLFDPKGGASGVLHTCRRRRRRRRSAKWLPFFGERQSKVEYLHVAPQIRRRQVLKFLWPQGKRCT